MSKYQFPVVLGLLLGFALACGSGDTTPGQTTKEAEGPPKPPLEQAKAAEEEGDIVTAQVMYKTAMDQGAGSPGAEAQTGYLRVTMKIMDGEAPVGSSGAVPIYRAALDNPALSAEAETWLARHVPEISVCESLRSPDAVTTWTQREAATEACMAVKKAFCADASKVADCIAGNGPYLAPGQRAVDTRKKYGKESWNRLALATGVGKPRAIMEDYLTVVEETRKKSTSGPSPVEWSDGKVHNMASTVWKCPTEGHPYCRGDFNVMCDADTDIILGVQQAVGQKNKIQAVALVLAATGDEDLANKAASWVTKHAPGILKSTSTAKKNFGQYTVMVNARDRDLLVTVTN